MPAYKSAAAGAEAVELAAMAGLHLDPWQAHILTESLGERDDAKWSAFEVGVVVSRQNGKGGLLEGRELAGLFLLREKLIIHSAHLFNTALEAFRRLLYLVENTPELDRRVQRVSRAHGEEGIELRDGSRIHFKTRTKGGGRGLTGDCVILDEAMELPVAARSALLPTLSARPNPQLWYLGSAVNKTIHDNGLVLTGIRERGLTGTDPSLAYFEFSPAEDLATLMANRELAADPARWAQANPALGIRIDVEYVANEFRSMSGQDFRGFCVERLSAGDWPNADDRADRVIDADVWAACADPNSAFTGPATFAVDVSPMRDQATIAVAGTRCDGLIHIEVIDSRPGTGWLLGRLADLAAAHPGGSTVIDSRSPAASLIADLDAAGVTVTEADTKDYTRACAAFHDDVTASKIRYRDPQPELTWAISEASVRPLGDAWAWSRKSKGDITPLVAATLARWGAAARTRTGTPQVWSLTDAVERLRKQRETATTAAGEMQANGTRLIRF